MTVPPKHQLESKLVCDNTIKVEGCLDRVPVCLCRQARARHGMDKPDGGVCKEHRPQSLGTLTQRHTCCLASENGPSNSEVLCHLMNNPCLSSTFGSASQ